VAVGSILSVLLLAGCGESTPAGSSDVASLQTANPAAAASASADSQEHPLRRPDDGPEVFERYVQVYFKCVVDKGGTVTQGEKPDVGGDAKSKAASAECWHLYPEDWLDRERRTNPEYADLLRAAGACVKAKGYHVTVGGDPLAIMYDNNADANKAYDDEQECLRTAFQASVAKYNKGGS